MSDKMSIDKKDPSKDKSDDESLESSPENEPGPTAPQENQPAKRKGGRKPIYATSEERKQRNRQAQAAFRERRTEYIKQLEETIRVHESNLSNLQAAHRSAADECLMLRYKNSLLERILLEKGIDVQAELRAKTGSPNLGPTHMPQNMVQPPPIQRAILSRHHHARRSASSIAPKLEPGATSLPPSMHGVQSTSSPKTRPTPPSHAASPTNPNPNHGFRHSAASPTTSDHPGMRPATSAPSMKPQIPTMLGPMAAAAARQGIMQPGSGVGGNRGNAYYPTPSFQNHIEQLGKLTRFLTEQEYDAPNDMIDEVEPDTPGPGPYPSAFPGGPQQHALQMQQPATSGTAGQQMMVQNEQPVQTQGQGYPSMTQLLDPALDWDPFGLSASMAFPTQFSFDTSNMR
ncbi:uncharacterized protein BCR38DRAFT_332604 [Pseudomassariella vexata]|uniref:BZIP domain-containing protein n=1 Tax=Pseudomassariella vexata TaxID=1141098 RepID=A0A1Y2EEJ0_9PEZI|nr:uncharacterized protein BCR38DRAFT_332604 [Pseudomassariella vexata]ORY69734.1 hypothetical protein BCR38DRAFT_332604 [Pseudomassariella vexata]